MTFRALPRRKPLKASSPGFGFRLFPRHFLTGREKKATVDPAYAAQRLQDSVVLDITSVIPLVLPQGSKQIISRLT
jgi:hypothetical protein